jgi:hypothetical protein
MILWLLQIVSILKCLLEEFPTSMERRFGDMACVCAKQHCSSNSLPINVRNVCPKKEKTVHGLI